MLAVHGEPVKLDKHSGSLNQPATMTRRELALLRTARSTEGCLDRYQDSWNSLPGFAHQREVVRAKLEALEALAGDAAPDRGDLAGQRQLAIQALAEEAWVVAGQVQAWAAACGDEALRQAALTTRDELVWLQMSLPERALQIHQRATECLRCGNGADFGLSAARLDRLAERIQALKILRVPPARAAGSVSPEEVDLGASLDEVMDLLCGVMDPLMRRFRSEDPGFYEAYQAARRVVDPDTGTLLTSEDELTSLDEGSPALRSETAGTNRLSAGSRTSSEVAVLNS